MGVRLPARSLSSGILPGPFEFVSTSVLFPTPLPHGRALAELIIPEEETPGAKQAGVAEFIDFMVANRVR